MSRVADKRNTFAGGHNAAAVISSAFFCREQKLDADTQKEILAYLDARLFKNPIYAAARPKEAADPRLVEGLLEDLDAGIATLRGKGHNIIFAVTCLKALRAVPEAAMPERIDGLRKMVRSFGKTGGRAANESDPLVGLDDEQKFVHFVFEEFLRAKGDGFDGHVVTIGHALVELHRMGHKELARKGVPAYWQWVREARAGDDEGESNVIKCPLFGHHFACHPLMPRPTPDKHRIGEIVSIIRPSHIGFHAQPKDMKVDETRRSDSGDAARPPRTDLERPLIASPPERSSATFQAPDRRGDQSGEDQSTGAVSRLSNYARKQPDNLYDFLRDGRHRSILRYFVHNCCCKYHRLSRRVQLHTEPPRPTYSRRDIVDEDRVGVYHCIVRCVRRAFLCGTDPYSGRDFSHRKAWVRDRLRQLAGLFGVEVCEALTAFAAWPKLRLHRNQRTMGAHSTPQSVGMPGCVN